jgi:predicted phage tail component-like protein
MAEAFTFNGTDMSAYGLTVTDNNADDYSDNVEIIQTKNQGYVSGEYMPPRPLDLVSVVQGTSIADLKTKLRNIVSVLRTGTEENLILDDDTSKLYKARFKGKSKLDKWGNTIWQGTLSFICPDPLAYSTTETSSDFNIDADPDTVIETVGGNAITRPVWTLTAGETLTDVTIILKNNTTNEEISWEGSLASTDTLEIDSALWTVKKNGALSMSGVDPSGKFPRLAVGINSITVTGLSTTGTLNITYRDAFI